MPWTASRTAAAAAAAAATTAAVSAHPHRKARRVRPRSRPSPPPPLPPPPPFRATSGPSGVHRIAGRKKSPEEAGALSTYVFLLLLVVSAGAAPAAAVAAAVSASTSSSSSSRFPFYSATPTSNAADAAAAVATAFCFPPPSRRPVDSFGRGDPGLRPSATRRLHRHSTNSAVSPVTGRSRTSRCWCAASAASPSPLRPSQRRRRTGEWVRGWKRWCDGGGDGDASASLRRVGSTVGSGYMDEWGGGSSTEETSYRPDDGRAAAAAAAAAAAGPWEGDWGEDTELRSSFGFAGDLSNGAGEDGSGGGGAAMGAVSPLSERDVARLEEVGIMVKELEADHDDVDGGDDGDGVAGMSSPGPRFSGEDNEEDVDGGLASLAPSSASEADEEEAPRRSDFVGGAAVSSSRLRMTCGDPVFFGQLAELMQGLHRRSGGRKFLTHAEEMELGVKVQRYRRLIEVRREKNARAGATRNVFRSVATLVGGGGSVG